MHQSIQAIFLSTKKGELLYSKYFDKTLSPSGVSEYFSTVHQETVSSVSSSAQLAYIQFPIAFRRVGSSLLYVVGVERENELLLCDVLSNLATALMDAVEGSPASDSIKAVYIHICLVFAEIVDEQGFILSGGSPTLELEDGQTKTFQNALSGAKFIAKTLLS
eukprot:gnl/Dysnectes_brevis/2397_a2843_2336.p1 GENE.gnl/Dysnectes_brevis/2397_a2843_2336~~gnl/Dysnectes_brevis/2397_a2843_2336.p1  ORF type:complete len:172 (+),score=2.46 gnl/Dysnectes_brevis/2397_a2843_2336:30-518(+)